MSEPARSPSYGRHRQSEFALAADLKHLRNLAEELGEERLIGPIEEALDRIENHHFSIAVVGEFNRGKSTFINALLGKEVLPADILPTSATINRVTYGLSPGVEVLFKSLDGESEGRRQAIAIDELADYVTKLTAESESRAASIQESLVSYPNPFLKNNVDIIDTPGLSDEAAMTEVTLGVLPRVDAAILVVMSTAPFAQSEAQFLESLLVEHGLGRVLFVVTAMDKIQPEESRQRLLDSIVERIRSRIQEHAGRHFGEGSEEYQDYLARVGEPKVFGISGYNALKAKVDRDEDLLGASGFPNLEAYLEEFLTTESGLVALQTHTERVLYICRQLEKGASAALSQGSSGAETPMSGKEGAPQVVTFYLDTLEDMGRAFQKLLEKLRKKGHELADQQLTKMPEVLKEDAGRILGGLNPDAANLENDRLPTYLAGLLSELSQALEEKSSKAATVFQQSLAAVYQEASLDLLRLAVACDRIFLQMQGEAASAGRAGRKQISLEPQDSLLQRLDASPGFDSAKAVNRSQSTLLASKWQQSFEEYHRALSLSSQWQSEVRLEGLKGGNARFMKKAIDLVRVEKFKRDLRKGVLGAIDQDFSRRWNDIWAQLRRQVTGSLESFETEGEHILGRIRAQRDQARRQQDRLEIEHEQRKQRFEALIQELEAIRRRTTVLNKQVTGRAH